MASKRLQDKVAIVTGGAGTIGKGIVTTFHNDGARVIIADINFEAAVAVAAELGAPAEAFRLDSRKTESWEECLEFVLRVAGKLDIVVNNAGKAYANIVAELVPEETFDDVMTLNVKSMWASVHAIVPYFLKEERKGCFIQTASVTAIRPGQGVAWYTASKGAVITATKALAVEYGPRGIRFNAVSPDVLPSQMTNIFLGTEATPELLEPFAMASPLRRLVTPADIGNACCFLASDQASFITGVNLEVDGGRSI